LGIEGLVIACPESSIRVSSPDFEFIELESDIAAISYSALIALGGIWMLFFSDSFDDDDDQDGGGTMSPVFEPVYAGNST